MWFVYPPQNQQHKVQANRLKGKHSNRTLKGHYIPRQLASLCSNPLYFISSNQDKLQWSRRVLWEWDVLGLKWNIKHCYVGYWPWGQISWSSLLFGLSENTQNRGCSNDANDGSYACCSCTSPGDFPNHICHCNLKLLGKHFWLNRGSLAKKTLPQGFPTVEETIFIHRTL